MLPHQSSPPPKQPESPSRLASIIQPSSPRYPLAGTGGGGGSPAGGGHRRLGIAVDLSDESAYAVRWAVQNYIRHDDSVILLHVRPTSVLYGADWGFVDRTADGDGGDADEETRRKMEDDFDAFTMKKLSDLAQPLVEAKIAFKMHIVKDHDLKERLCLEVERLGLSVVIMGSRGFGAAKRGNKGRLGSVSDYCVHHCVCPVVVVRLADERDGGGDGGADVAAAEVALVREAEVALHMAEEEHGKGEKVD